MSDTITSAGICARYKISRPTLVKWRRDPTFPAPLEWHERRGGVWRLEDVVTWRRRKRSGRGNTRAAAVRAYQRRLGEHGALSETADAYGVSLPTMRAWITAAGLPLPRALSRSGR